MDINSASKTVAQIFIKNISDLCLNKSGGICLGKSVVKKEQLYDKLFSRLPPDIQASLIKEFTSDILKFKESSFLYPLEIHIIEGLKAATVVEEEPIIDPSDVYFNDSIKSPLSDIKYIRNLKAVKKSALYDVNTDSMYQWDNDLIIETLKFKLGAKVGFPAWMSKNQEHCLFEYNPKQKNRIFYEPNSGQKKFNTWTRAAWEAGFEPIKGAECPAEIKEFFNCLIPGDSDRKYMYSWLRDCCFSKAYPINVLCGPPGIGKNNYVLLAKALVGENNYREASRGFSTSQFHNNVSDCRCFFLDELDLTAKTRDTLKAYHNGQSAIERKGVDVGDPEKIHASFIIANNFEEKIRLDYTDRKFFAAKLTDIPLLEQIVQEKVDYLFQELILDQDFIRQFASYLYFNFEHNQSEKFRKTEFFKKLCINSYPSFFRRFITACHTLKSFNRGALGKDFKHKIDPMEILRYVEHYEKTFRTPLVHFEVKLDGTWEATSRVEGICGLPVSNVAPSKSVTHKNSEVVV